MPLASKPSRAAAGPCWWLSDWGFLLQRDQRGKKRHDPTLTVSISDRLQSASRSGKKCPRSICHTPCRGCGSLQRQLNSVQQAEQTEAFPTARGRVKETWRLTVGFDSVSWFAGCVRHTGDALLGGAVETLKAPAGGSFQRVVDGVLKVSVWIGGDRRNGRSGDRRNPTNAPDSRSYLDHSTADVDTWILWYIYPDILHSGISGTEVPDRCPTMTYWSLKNIHSQTQRKKREFWGLIPVKKLKIDLEKGLWSHCHLTDSPDSPLVSISNLCGQKWRWKEGGRTWAAHLAALSTLGVLCEGVTLGLSGRHRLHHHMVHS